MFYNLIIFFDFRLADSNPYESTEIILKDTASFVRLFEKLLYAYQKSTPSSKARCLAIANEISAKIIVEQQNTANQNDISKLQFVLNYLQANYLNRSISIANLAQQCFISEVHLRRLFKKVYNISPMQFVIKLRLEQAKHLLLSGELSVEQIANTCGFYDVYSFSKMFKNFFGLSPKKYQQKNSH